ncbi:MAG: DNA polymerase, partial [Gemmatimonadota bacterium]
MVEVPEKTRPRLFLIDGYALIYRAFFAMINRPLTTTRGENTSAEFGFVRFLLKILEEHGPDYLGVVMDAGSSERTALYPAYKATREKMPVELRSSLPRIRELIDAFRVPVIELEDHEADDVIGTLARRAAERGIEAVIVSGDKDFYQLIGPGISLLNPGRGGTANVQEEWVDRRNASDRLGVEPEHVIDYLALIGDSSDNIPGAPGIGPKTALKLIEQYGDLEQILANVDAIKGKRARESLQENAAGVRLSKDLVTIRTELPVELDLEALGVVEPDRERLRDLFVALEFHSLARELGAPEQLPTRLERDYRLADTVEAVDAAIEAVRRSGRMGLSLVATSADPMRGEIVGIGIAAEPGLAWYLPFRHRRPGVLDLEGVQVRNLPPLNASAMRPLVELLQSADIECTGHDLKTALLLLRRAGVTLGGIAFDTEIASYVADPGRRDHLLTSLALQHFGVRRRARDEITGKGRTQVPLEEVEVETVRDWVAEAADLPLRLRAALEPELEAAHLEPLYREIELPLMPVLADMEYAGIRIDAAFFRQQSEKLARELRMIEEEIYKEAGEEFNINSTPQLRTILFEKLELPAKRKTKTGASTDASVLEELAGAGHTLPRLILE